jgi:hypothetical protein
VWPTAEEYWSRASRRNDDGRVNYDYDDFDDNNDLYHYN